jgi:hypothetical protein
MAETSSAGSSATSTAADTQKPAAQIPPPVSLRVGPLTVRAGAAETEAFRRETLASDKGVPFTFPMRWFTHPDIRSAGTGLLGPEPWIPLHESQSFDYECPLEIDVDYQMSVDIIREFEPARLILRAEIGKDTLCLRSEMILRIIPVQAAETSK